MALLPIQQPVIPPHVPIGQKLTEIQDAADKRLLTQQAIQQNSIKLKQQQDEQAQQAASDAVIARGGTREDMIQGMSKAGTEAYTNFQKYLSQVDTDNLNRTKTSLDIAKSHTEAMGNFMNAVRGKKPDDPTVPLIYKHYKDSLVDAGDPLAKSMPDQYDPNFLAQYDDVGKTLKQLSDTADAEYKKRDEAGKAQKDTDEHSQALLDIEKKNSDLSTAGQTDDLKEFNQSGYYNTYLADNKIDPAKLNKSTEAETRGRAFIAFKRAQTGQSPTQASLAVAAANGDKTAKAALDLLQNESEEGSSITPGSLDMLATQFAKTGALPPLGMGKSAAGDRRQIINRAAQLYPKVDLATNSADYAANKNSERTLQTNRDQVVSFENTAGKNLDNFLSAAGKVVDSGSQWVNKPLRTVDQGALGSADLAAFNAARKVAINEIAKVTSNPGLTGQLSDSARHEVESFIPQDATLSQVAAVAKVLKSDMKNRHDSLDDQLKAIQDRIASSPKAGPSAPGADATKVRKYNPATGKLE